MGKVGSCQSLLEMVMRKTKKLLVTLSKIKKIKMGPERARIKTSSRLAKKIQNTVSLETRATHDQCDQASSFLSAVCTVISRIMLVNNVALVGLQESTWQQSWNI